MSDDSIQDGLLRGFFQHYEHEEYLQGKQNLIDYFSKKPTVSMGTKVENAVRFPAQLRRKKSVIKIKSVATPVSEPCKFLCMYTRESKVSGCPVGITQHCTHPVHREFDQLRSLVEHLMLFLRELINDWDIQRNPITLLPSEIEVIPKEALELPDPAKFKLTLLMRLDRWVQQLRTVWDDYRDVLADYDNVEGSTSDTKGFTKKFEEQEK